jgi:hypothetical protein
MPNLEARKMMPPGLRLDHLEQAVGFAPATFNFDQRIQSLTEHADAEF